MIIESLSDRLFLLRLKPGSLEPKGGPLVRSLINVYKCQAGFLLEHTSGILEYGGFYLLAKSPKTRYVTDTNRAIRSKELVVFDTAGRVTLAMSPIVSPLIQAILDKQ